MMKIATLFVLLLSVCSLSSQDRWQQEIEYEMDIDFDVKNHQYNGDQKIKYTNNSPDTLDRFFYHLYFNAFQPGSMMDVRSQNIPDPDKRVAERIGQLKDNEIGYQKITSLKYNGQEIDFEVVGTILEIDLPKPILPGKSVKFEMEFETQVPVQIRRSGRDNSEGISYSMTQWYPKVCEYDYQGWHANPYIGREFHGVWGDFKVNIKIDKKYIVAASGKLKNANKIGYGYQDDLSKEKRPKGLKKKITWEFEANDVHDFAWAADKEYTHIRKESKSGTMLHYLFQDNEETQENWRKLHEAMSEAEIFLNENFGVYPYDSYAFVQGGDGGMEYPLITLITGHRSLGSLVGVSVHEWVHSWYQLLLGTNESLYAWMDEGFTSYASAECMNHLRAKGILDGEVRENPLANSVMSYAGFTQSGIEEPLSTHADHFSTNAAYGVGSYTKGSVFLKQLEYIVGKQIFKKAMIRYFNEWKYKHPNPNDFIRVMEKTSGLELDWYKEYFVYTTKTIDYGIQEFTKAGDKTIVSLSKDGEMPMPLDLFIKMKDGSEQIVNIPLRIMRGEKPSEKRTGNYSVAKDWPWTNPFYKLSLDVDADLIEFMMLYPLGRVADINDENNIFPRLEVPDEENK